MSRHALFAFTIIIVTSCGPSNEDDSQKNQNESANLIATSSDAWKKIETGLTAPAARIMHTATWSGQEVLIFGGIVGGLSPGWTQSGGRYEPIADEWKTISTTNAPTSRSGHCAVWTGTKMFVWGGEAEGSVKGDGALYDPLGDSWTQVSTNNAPAARMWHGCVLIGAKIMVWGGIGASSTDAISTGALYDLASDSWQEIATTDATPFIHFQFGFGFSESNKGYFFSGFTGEFGSYDPALDKWTKISSSGIPSKRFSFNATNTSEKLVVWGGLAASDGSSLGDGAIFDLQTSTWSELPTSGAPDKRYGSEMASVDDQFVVWGGWQPGTATEIVQGGRFDRTTNQWLPLEVAGAPTSRSFHTVLPIANAIFVWGGTNFLPVWDTSKSIISHYRDSARNAVTTAREEVAAAKAKGQQELEDLLEKPRQQSTAEQFCSILHVSNCDLINDLITDQIIAPCGL